MRRNIIPDEVSDFLRYDPESGKLFWKAALGTQRHIIGRETGTPTGDGRPYLRVKFRGIKYPVAHVAYFLMTGKRAGEVDHIDNDPSNNRWSNLREATHSQNCSNRRSWKSGKKGAYRTKAGTFSAIIAFEGRRRHLGTFATEDAAHAAYAAAAAVLHGDFARTF